MKSFIYKTAYKKKRFAATLNLTGSYTFFELRSILFFRLFNKWSRCKEEVMVLCFIFLFHIVFWLKGLNLSFDINFTMIVRYKIDHRQQTSWKHVI